MGLKYKIDVLEELKKNGFNTNKIRKNKLLSESTLQRLRRQEPLSWTNIEHLCKLLKCQPGDILEYVDEDEEKGD